ncbi:uncharacterized protein EV154DRAFT_500518 [Mucor mucedo]|uniref:uncharacterized protein n=1 Tax=Mucor mucedo TaxID=29922 RepID=UPI00221E44F6|nr:uncharacterized protein EV154DRAFT_500518 [Mucor mucedo]KAI7893701.1 hypothetical protein EV154DRAFT_500518 [Mucor mucedo]
MAPLPKSIIDSHVHFWQPDKVNVPWVKNSQFDKRKDAVDYAEQVKLARVKQAVYVETDVDVFHKLVEAEWIYKYSQEIQTNDSFGGIGGIVAFAPVQQGDHVVGYLRTLVRVTGGADSILKGVRCLLQDPNLDPARVLEPDFIRGIQCLESFKLSFDICIDCRSSPQQFPPIQKMVVQCPRVQFILDHMGKPPCDSQPGDTEFEFWKQQMTQLSSNPNVSCKISGLVTEFNDSHHDEKSDVVRKLKPFIQVALETFGIDRLMYGGDWPVSEAANTTWQSWLEIISELVNHWSEDDKEKLFVTNATRIYKLLNHTK